VLFTQCCTSTFAATLSTGNNSVISSGALLTELTRGVTEDGISYVVYLKNNIKDNTIRPYTLLSKPMSVRIDYYGKIIPPSSFYYSGTEGSLVWTGTLLLDDYWHQDRPVSGWHTEADYEGTVFTTV